MIDNPKLGKLIFEDASMKIFYNPNRDLITTMEHRPRTGNQGVYATSFSSTNYINFIDRDNLEVESVHLQHKCVLIAMLSLLDIKNFEIRPLILVQDGNFKSRYIIKFDNESDYAFFKLKNFDNFRKYDL